MLEKIDDLRLNGYIQGCDRFIGHQQLGLHRKGAGNGHTLALTTGKLCGILVQIALIHTHILQLELRFRAQTASGRLDAMDGHRLSNNICHRHALIEAGSGVLEDYLPGSFQHSMVLLKLCTVANIDAFVGDLACGRLVDIHNAPGNGGLTGTGFTYESKDLTLLDLEGHIIHCLDGNMLAQLKHMGKVLNIEEYFRHLLSLQSVHLLSALWGLTARLPHNEYR